MRATAAASESEYSRTTTGTSRSPAICAARQRRSPATISCPPLARGRTTIGWTMPRERTECASSSRADSSTIRRGWCRPRWMRSTGRLRTLSFPTPLVAPGPVSGVAGAPGMFPRRASRPRPSPRFLDISGPVDLYGRAGFPGRDVPRERLRRRRVRTESARRARAGNERRACLVGPRARFASQARALTGSRSAVGLRRAGASRPPAPDRRGRRSSSCRRAGPEGRGSEPRRGGRCGG